MPQTILVCGYGPGISDAVARRFGKAGHRVALVGRKAERVQAAAKALAASGVQAAAFPADLSDAATAAGVVGEARAALGPIDVIHWNAYGAGAGDLTVAGVPELRAQLELGVVSPVAALQAALPDLKAHKGSFLITGGGFSVNDPKVDAMVVQSGSMGLAVAKAAQVKLAGILAERLRGDGVHVGEVVVMGLVKGTAWDRGNATVDPNDVAEKFWQLHTGRAATFVNIP